jgi:hypothetical protein
MMFAQDFGGGADTGTFSDFSTRLGGSGGGGGNDLASQLGGVLNSFVGGSAGGAGGGFSLPSAGGGGASGGMTGNDFATGAGALAGAAGGAAFGIPPEIGGKIGAMIGGLFGGKGTDASAQSADINKIAAVNGVTGAEAAAVIANHADHSSDHFDDLARSVATFDAARFPSLLSEYNQAHPEAPIVMGSVRKQAEAVASSQQQLISTALQTNGFAATATGQQLVASLQALPSNQAVGTQGQTAGDVLTQILQGIGGGIIKGGTDAAAETDLGKSMKADYIKTWLKDNQLLAGIITAVLGFTAYRAYAPKGRKASL